MSEDIFGSQTSSAVHLVTIVDMKGILADVNTASRLTWPYRCKLSSRLVRVASWKYWAQNYYFP